MKLLSTAPLTALSASFFTWYLQSKPPAAPAAGLGGAAAGQAVALEEQSLPDRVQPAAERSQNDSSPQCESALAEELERQTRYREKRIQSMRAMVSWRDQRIRDLEAALSEEQRRVSLLTEVQQGNATHDDGAARELVPPLPQEEARAAPAVAVEVGREEAERGGGAGNPFDDMSGAASQVSTLLQDVAQFAADSLAAYLWRWPADPATSRQGPPMLDVVAGAAAVSARQVRQLLPDSAAGLWEWLPLEMRSQLQHALAAAQQGLREQRARAEVEYPQLALLGGQAASWLHSAASATRAAAEGGRLSLESAAGAARAWLQEATQLFLQRHPEHRAAVGDKDPLVLVFALAVIAAALLAEALRMLRLAREVLRYVLRLASKVLCAPLCCCRCRGRRAGGGGTGWQASGGGRPGGAPAAARRLSRRRLSDNAFGSEPQGAPGKSRSAPALGDHSPGQSAAKNRFESPPRWVRSRSSQFSSKGGA